MLKHVTVALALLATYAAPAAINKPSQNRISQLEIPQDPSTVQKRGDFLGDGTWYTTETGRPGSCGEWLNDGMMVVALNAPQMGDGGECGHEVWVTNITNGKTQTARVVDKCPECLWGSLDMSPTLFECKPANSLSLTHVNTKTALCGGELGLGRIPITWGFCDREHGC
ncbi:hypothetical protein E3Q18_03263 [Wallemia mellicola]|uniref:RlpA-like protein double-psi beta-barrel domain-containing protein n=1 Tax=Wallemia mellicola TaxID=1708541 RepID=A0A4T0T0F3_9BASI|nr:hypothetical protein E3Q23_03091 [Wallemia mellicola]TIB73574.1 hypothetical protein E3Q24_01061 [Wallemia mellicola]TIB85030.1 hypothetical protein E3Q21_02140 [Wallemia mellicola]TIB88275.1 hypothetical protein E3Q20_02133 [Wallemia mellicola]TIB88929.1 hypothetical protein E3Q19_03193 [Wallemia mellicola]